MRYNSKDLEILNLRGKVKSIKESTYKYNFKKDSFELHDEGLGTENYYCSKTFEHQKPKEITGIIGGNNLRTFSKKGHITSIIAYNKEYDYVITYQNFNEAISRETAYIRRYDEKEKVSYTFDYDIDNCWQIRNQKDTLVLINCKRDSIIKKEI